MHVSDVLLRELDCPVLLDSEWLRRLFDDGETPLAREWAYTRRRVVEEGYGNGHTYELAGFEVAEPGDISRVVNGLRRRAGCGDAGSENEVVTGLPQAGAVTRESSEQIWLQSVAAAVQQRSTATWVR
jgi:hypothetical protein